MVVVMSKLCGAVTMYCTHVLEYIEGLRWNMTALDVYNIFSLRTEYGRQGLHSAIAILP